MSSADQNDENNDLFEREDGQGSGQGAEERGEAGEEDPQAQLEESIKSWVLEPLEIQFLNDLYNEIQEAQALANGLKEDARLDNEEFAMAAKDIETVKNVIEVIGENSDREDDIRFAIDNALLTLATSKRKTEDDNASLRTVVRERNVQLRNLVMKVKDQEQQLKHKDELISKMEKQLVQQSSALRQLQSRVDDEHRFRVVQEQLRKPKDNKYYDDSKYVDSNARNDPFDFWQSNAPAVNFEYPGDPKRLNEIVNKKQLWVAQKEESVDLRRKVGNSGQNKNRSFWGS